MATTATQTFQPSVRCKVFLCYPELFVATQYPGKGVRRSNNGNIDVATDTPRLRREVINEDERIKKRGARVAKQTGTRMPVHRGSLAFANHPVIPNSSNVSALADELSSIGWQGQKLYDELVCINDEAERGMEANRRRHRDAVGLCIWLS